MAGIMPGAHSLTAQRVTTAGEPIPYKGFSHSVKFTVTEPALVVALHKAEQVFLYTAIIVPRSHKAADCALLHH